MFKSNKVRNRVMEVLDKKLEEAQKAHDEHCEMLERQLEEDKVAHLENLVGSFVAKFM